MQTSQVFSFKWKQSYPARRQTASRPASALPTLQNAAASSAVQHRPIQGAELSTLQQASPLSPPPLQCLKFRKAVHISHAEGWASQPCIHHRCWQFPQQYFQGWRCTSMGRPSPGTEEALVQSPGPHKQYRFSLTYHFRCAFYTQLRNLYL